MKNLGTVGSVPAFYEIAGGEKDIAVYLIVNDKAVPFYEKIGMKKSDDVMQLSKVGLTDFVVE